MNLKPIFEWLEQYLNGTQIVMLFSVLGFGAIALAVYLLLLFKSGRRRQNKTKPTNSSADAKKPVDPAEGLELILKAIVRLRPMLIEIARDFSSRQGGPLPSHLREESATLMSWLSFKEEYLQSQKDSMDTVGAPDSFVAAIIVELHDALAPFDDALEAASKDRSHKHWAKFFQYSEVINAVVDSLSFKGEPAYRQLMELRELKVVTLYKRAGVVRDTAPPQYAAPASTLTTEGAPEDGLNGAVTPAPEPIQDDAGAQLEGPASGDGGAEVDGIVANDAAGNNGDGYIHAGPEVNGDDNFRHYVAAPNNGDGAIHAENNGAHSNTHGNNNGEGHGDRSLETDAANVQVAGLD